MSRILITILFSLMLRGSIPGQEGGVPQERSGSGRKSGDAPVKVLMPSNATGLRLDAVPAGDSGTADPKAEKHVRAVLLPGDEVSFRRDGVELTRLVYGKDGERRRRPYLFPVIGPSGNPLTISHGHDAESMTHNSIWHSFAKMNGITLEGKHSDARARISTGREVNQRLENRTDGDESASVTVVVHWVDVAQDPPNKGAAKQDPGNKAPGKRPAVNEDSPKLLFVERRRYTVRPLDKGEW